MIINIELQILGSIFQGMTKFYDNTFAERKCKYIQWHTKNTFTGLRGGLAGKVLAVQVVDQSLDP